MIKAKQEARAKQSEMARRSHDEEARLKREAGATEQQLKRTAEKEATKLSIKINKTQDNLKAQETARRAKEAEITRLEIVRMEKEAVIAAKTENHAELAEQLSTTTKDMSSTITNLTQKLDHVTRTLR